MNKQNLLVELFVEELPPKALPALGDAFASVLIEQLRSLGLAGKNSQAKPFATPRRLAAHITLVAARAEDQQVQRKLMPVAIGLDAQGSPTPALLKKLATFGADASVVAQLKREHDGKQEVLFYDSVVQGVDLEQGLQKSLDVAIAKLPIPKVMSYQLDDGWTTVHFVRPAHAIVALHGEEVVPVSALGLTAGRTTHGHRFEAAADPITINSADSYERQLHDEGAVIAGFSERAQWIQTQLHDAARAVGGGVKPVADAALLGEVTALVERPHVMTCQFEKEFLMVPQECLILTMKANQKYFPLLDARGKLTNHFLVVSNINPTDPSAVIGGNERVIRPRLADAKFFFDQDRRKRLADRLGCYAQVVYHNKLGTLADRVARVRHIAQKIAEKLMVSGGFPAELALEADLAAKLSKADLFTDMVGEFPELQGVMGRYYALHDGLSVEVADAIEDHYKPRFAGDELPRGTVGLVVALADKLETLIGMFGIGNAPTGDKDPFALRRHALGVIRMLTEKALPLTLDWLLETAAGGFVSGAQGVDAAFNNPSRTVADFIYERLAGLLREQGYSAQKVDAVLSLKPQRLSEVVKRLEAVCAFTALPEAPALAAANKRVSNILKKSTETVQALVDPALLQEPAEVGLFAALQDAQVPAGRAFDVGDYKGALKELAVLKLPVDTFFDEVMVNADDETLRRNRLGLLALLHQVMNRIADLSRLA